MSQDEFSESILNIQQLLARSEFKQIVEQYLPAAKSETAPCDLIRVVAQAAYSDSQAAQAVSILLEAKSRFLNDAAFWHDLSFYQSKTRDFTAAKFSIENCLQLRPNYPASLLIYGNILKALLKFEAAILQFREIIAIEPQNISALNNLATTLVRTGDYAEAEKIYIELIALSDASSSAEYNYANLLEQTGRYAEALFLYRKMLNKNPGLLAAWNNAGQTLMNTGELAEAQKCFDQALKLDSDSAEVLFNQAKLLQMRGEIEESIKLYSILSKGSSQINELAQINLCFLLNFSDKLSALEVFGAHKELHKNLSDKFKSTQIKRCNNVRPRIAYLSADFRTHSVAYFSEAILKNHTKEKFDIYIYANQATRDEVTERIISLGHDFKFVKHYSDSELLQLIRADKIDLLVDLSGLTTGHRAFVLSERAAPVQINYLGYPHSSGIPNVDFRIVDSVTDPLDNLATEKLIRLDPCFICYQPQKKISEFQKTSSEIFRFGCFNALAKLSDTVISIWAKILHAVPGSVLVLKSYAMTDKYAKQKIAQRFNELQIDSSRLILKDFYPDTKEHLAHYNEIDLALDSFPYCGTTTSCEALSSGTPMITLYGDRHSSRVGASILKATGLEQLITYTEQEYIDKAVELASNRKTLTEIVKKLIEHFPESELCNQKTFTHRWEKMLLDILQKL